MTTDPKSIAEGLSEAGRECLGWVTPCSIIATFRRGAEEVERLRLVEYRDRFFHITPLGLAVRKHLEESKRQ